MKNYITLIFTAICLVASQSCKSPQPPAIQKFETKHVVVIGIDGMSPDGVIKANTPVMDSLMKAGSYTLHARGVLPTSSSPNWASMISGAGPEQHGITANSWEKDEPHMQPIATLNGEIFPTIFAVLRQQKPEAEIGVIYHWDGFGRLFEKDAVNYDVHGETERETAQLAANYIKEKKPDFTFIHYDHVDGAGHGSGHGSPEYYKSVELADSLIGVVVNAVKQSGMLDETVIIISSDHGGLGTSHGGETLEEIEIPFIISGKGVKKNYQIPHEVYTYDNAATVAFAFGVQQPYAWIGRAVKSAFEGYENPAAFVVKTMLAAPVIKPEKHLFEPAGGLFIDTIPFVEITSEIAGVEIRYTLDGNEPDKSSALYNSQFKVEKTTVVKAAVFKGDEKSYASSANFRLLDSKAGNGINFKYYEGENWTMIPNLSMLKPKATGKAKEFRIQYALHRDEQYALEFDAYLKIDSAGEYRFYTYSDDGSKLYIDDKEVVNNDGSHGAKEKTGDTKLEKGLHKIKVTYFNEGGGQWLEVFYRGPGVPRQIIPASALYPPK